LCARFPVYNLKGLSRHLLPTPFEFKNVDKPHRQQSIICKYYIILRVYYIFIHIYKRLIRVHFRRLRPFPERPRDIRHQIKSQSLKDSIYKLQLPRQITPFGVLRIENQPRLSVFTRTMTCKYLYTEIILYIIHSTKAIRQNDTWIHDSTIYARFAYIMYIMCTSGTLVPKCGSGGGGISFLQNTYTFSLSTELLNGIIIVADGLLRHCCNVFAGELKRQWDCVYIYWKCLLSSISNILIL